MTDYIYVLEEISEDGTLIEDEVFDNKLDAHSRAESILRFEKNQDVVCYKLKKEDYDKEYYWEYAIEDERLLDSREPYYGLFKLDELNIDNFIDLDKGDDKHTLNFKVDDIEVSAVVHGCDIAEYSEDEDIEDFDLEDPETIKLLVRIADEENQIYPNLY